MAMCVMAVLGEAPCQCLSPGGNHTTSPALISSMGPPSRCTHPRPAVTISVCPSGWVCHAVRAPGSKVTRAPLTRPGCGAWKRGSTRTEPVNQSEFPFVEGREPFLDVDVHDRVPFRVRICRVGVQRCRCGKTGGQEDGLSTGVRRHRYRGRFL